eukprot:scaffold2207_cov370-Prasinococcus_capsulatus_cf.AAC.7
MGMSLANEAGKDLYAFWGEEITELLAADVQAQPAQEGRFVVNLASQVRDGCPALLPHGRLSRGRRTRDGRPLLSLSRTALTGMCPVVRGTGVLQGCALSAAVRAGHSSLHNAFPGAGGLCEDGPRRSGKVGRIIALDSRGHCAVLLVRPEVCGGNGCLAQKFTGADGEWKFVGEKVGRDGLEVSLTFQRLSSEGGASAKKKTPTPTNKAKVKGEKATPKQGVKRTEISKAGPRKAAKREPGHGVRRSLRRNA